MNKPFLFAFSAASLLCACTPVPAKDADPQPAQATSVEVVSQWQLPSDGAAGEMVATAAGDEGAMAYAESEGWTDQDGYTQTRLKLQRFDSTGAKRGAAVELGVLPSE